MSLAWDDVALEKPSRKSTFRFPPEKKSRANEIYFSKILFLGIGDEVYSSLIGDMRQDQVNMLNNQMPTAMPPGRPKQYGSMKKVI
ncbi:hypothetical protein AB8Q02_09225 [Enterobacter ludwigii]